VINTAEVRDEDCLRIHCALHYRGSESVTQGQAFGGVHAAAATFAAAANDADAALK